MTDVTETPPAAAPTSDSVKTIEDLATAYERIRAEHAERECRWREEDERARAVRREHIKDLRQFVASLAASASPAPADADEHATWTKVTEHRRELYQQIWRNDTARERFTALDRWSLDDFDAVHAEVARRYIGQLGPDAAKLNLLIVGDVGAAKTSLALTIGRLAVEQGLLTRVVSHVAYTSMLQPGAQPANRSADDVRRLYREHTDLLVLDDLGAEMEGGATDAAARETVRLLGDRLNTSRATIVTTNLSSDEVTEILGKRAYSRVGGASFVVKMLGEDRRRPPTW